MKTRQKLEDNASFAKKPAADPFMQEAMRVFPGLAPADQLVINGTARRRSRCRTPPPASRRSTSELLDRAWADAKRRGDKLPPVSQKEIPPTVPGQQ